MTWTAGGAGTIPSDAEDTYALTGGVDSVFFSGNHPYAPSSYTAAFTVYPFDNGHTYNNDGATAAVTGTLPTIFPGACYYFEDVENAAGADLNIDCQIADNFVKPNGIAMAAGEQYQSESDEYARIKVEYIAANTWQISEETGVWVEETGPYAYGDGPRTTTIHWFDNTTGNASSYFNTAGGVAYTGSATRGWIAPRDGCVISHSVQIQFDPCDADPCSLTVEVHEDGVDMGCDVVFTIADKKGAAGDFADYATFEYGAYEFDAGDNISIYATEVGTWGWDDTSGILEVMYYD
jgi:hypothetical protein